MKRKREINATPTSLRMLTVVERRAENLTSSLQSLRQLFRGSIADPLLQLKVTLY